MCINEGGQRGLVHIHRHSVSQTGTINYAMRKVKSCPRTRNTEAERKIERHLRQFLNENQKGMAANQLRERRKETGSEWTPAMRHSSSHP